MTVYPGWKLQLVLAKVPRMLDVERRLMGADEGEL
jgi:hypothetical protein